MTRRSRSTSTKKPSLDAIPRDGLSLHVSGQRFYALLRERERLLREVQVKKRRLERVIEETKASAQTMMEKLAPIMTRYHELNAEVHRVFDELLVPGKLSASARKKVKKIRNLLEAQGLLIPREEEPAEPSEFAGGDDDEPFEHPFGSPFQGSEVRSAAPRGQEAGHESLRALFKRLALALHPDRATHENDRNDRTEVMKQVTQAYNDGDLARLLELEKLWEQNGAANSTADEEARCSELEQTIAELRRQSRQLTAEHRAVKKSAPSNTMGGSVKVVVRQAQAELEEFQIMCDFVKSFRDGKITLAEFVRGPALPVDMTIDLDAVIEQLAREHFGARRTRARKNASVGKSRSARNVSANTPPETVGKTRRTQRPSH